MALHVTTTRWPLVPIKRFAQLVYGNALPAESRDDAGSVPVFGSNGAFGSHSSANTSSPVILVGRKGSVGALNWSDCPAFAIDTVYFIDEAHSCCDLRWLFWALQTAGLHTLSQDTGVPGLSREIAYGVTLPLPPQPEQAAIAAFLDRETAKIDALVEEQKRLIDLLKEKRQALISQGVTKGLNPDAPMKDTGIEWLGEVPEHWDVKALKRIAQLTVGIVVNPSTYVSDDGVPFIYGGDIEEGRINFDDARRITVSDSMRNGKTMLKSGDLLTVRVGAPGVTAVVPEACDGGNCASVMLIRQGDFNSDWLCFAMNSRAVRYQVEGVQYGAAQEQFNIGHAMEFKIPCPPVEEQTRITRFLAKEVGAIDELVQHSLRASEVLQERRAALISAAVTGKIDVRNFARTQDAAE